MSGYKRKRPFSGIEIKGLPELKNFFKSLELEGKKALVAAVNEGMDAAKKVAVEEIAKELNLPEMPIRSTVRIRRMRVDKPTGYMQCKFKKGWPAYDKLKPWQIAGKVPGLHFSGVKHSRYFGGYSFVFKHGHGRKYFPRAFCATMPKHGHVGIFFENKKKGKTSTRLTRKGTSYKSYPIKELISSTPADVLSNQKRLQPVLERASDLAQKELDLQISRILR